MMFQLEVSSRKIGSIVRTSIGAKVFEVSTFMIASPVFHVPGATVEAIKSVIGFISTRARTPAGGCPGTLTLVEPAKKEAPKR